MVNGKVLDHEMIWRQSWDQNPGFLGPSLLLQVLPCTDHRHTQNTNIGILLCGARAFGKSWASQPSSDFLHYQCSAQSESKPTPRAENRLAGYYEQTLLLNRPWSFNPN